MTASVQASAPPGMADLSSIARSRAFFSRRVIWGVLLLIVVGIVAFLPVLYVLVASLNLALPHQPYQFGLDGWIEVYSNRKTWGSVLVTFILAARVPIAVVIAFVLCWLLVRVEIPGRRFIEMTLWFGFFLPGIPMTMGWILLLDSNYGLLNVATKKLIGQSIFSISSIPGIMWVHIALTTVPVMVILLAPAFRQFESAFEEAAEVSGAGIWRTMRCVTIPLLAPALLTAFVASFIRSLETFEIEQIIGAPTGIYVYGTRVYDLVFSDPPRFAQAMAVSSLFLIILFAFAVPYHMYLMRTANQATIAGRGVRLQSGTKPKWVYAVSALVILYVVCTIILPFAVLIAGSFTRLFGFFFLENPWTVNHWVTVLTDQRFFNAAVTSVSLGVSSGIIGIVAFALLAWVLVRTDIWGRGLISLLIWLPWAIPGLVLGLTLLSLILSVPAFTMFNGTIFPLIFALVLKELPVGVQLIRASLAQVSGQLEEAAEVSGAGFLRIFIRVTLPLIAPTLVAVFLLTFAATIRDISTIVLIAAPGLRTLSLVMFDYAASGRFEAGAVLGVIVAAISLVMTVIAFRFGMKVGIGR
jgi:iron(III) transport system permease protein